MSAAAWLLQPLLCYALLAAGLALGLCLFLTLKSEIRGLLRRRLEEQRQVRALETALAEVRLALETLERDLRQVESQAGMLVPPQPARSGLNLSKRTQVLRMHRAGQDQAGIAAALALPRAEVELLLKVHQIAVGRL